MFAWLLKHKVRQTARLGLPPLSLSQVMRAQTREAYLNFTQDRHWQQRLVKASVDAQLACGRFPNGTI